MRSCSTSLPGGNQVDGLPPVLHIKMLLRNDITSSRALSTEEIYRVLYRRKKS